jgi:hypothetical protein
MFGDGDRCNKEEVDRTESNDVGNASDGDVPIAVIVDRGLQVRVRPQCLLFNNVDVVLVALERTVAIAVIRCDDSRERIVIVMLQCTFLRCSSIKAREKNDN